MTSTSANRRTSLFQRVRITLVKFRGRQNQRPASPISVADFDVHDTSASEEPFENEYFEAIENKCTSSNGDFHSVAAQDHDQNDSARDRDTGTATGFQYENFVDSPQIFLDSPQESHLNSASYIDVTATQSELSPITTFTSASRSQEPSDYRTAGSHQTIDNESETKTVVLDLETSKRFQYKSPVRVEPPESSSHHKIDCESETKTVLLSPEKRERFQNRSPESRASGNTTPAASKSSANEETKTTVLTGRKRNSFSFLGGLSPPLSNQKNDSTAAKPTLQKGGRVRIVKGVHKGKCGVIARMSKHYVHVEVIGDRNETVKCKQSSLETEPPPPPQSTFEEVHSKATDDQAFSAWKNKSSLSELLSTNNVDRASNKATSQRNRLSQTPPSTGTKKSVKLARLAVGDKVVITGGTKCMGAIGNITKVNPKTVLVKVPGEAKDIRKNLDYVELVSTTSNCSTSGEESVQDEDASRISGKTNSEKVTVDSEIPLKTRASSRSTNKAVLAKLTKSNNDQALNPFSNGRAWRAADSDKGGIKFGIRRVVKLRSETSTKENTFLAHWMQQRVTIDEIPVNKDEVKVPVGKSLITADGSKYELVANKIQTDGDAPTLSYFNAKTKKRFTPKRYCAQLFYVQTSGPGVETICLQDELEKIADFGRLCPRKAMARLELLLSTAYKFDTGPHKGQYALFNNLNCSSFCTIEEKGQEGCGFISKDFLVNLLGANKAAERVVAIQARVIIPSMGIFKGMLAVKPSNNDGSPPVQLTPSMRKVGPSGYAQVDDRAFLVITTNGVHPNTTNENVGRLLDPNGKKTTQAFTLKLKNDISDMILRLWKGLGVDEETLDSYAKACKSEENLNHAFIVGLADPTSQLPAGSVYIPGFRHAPKQVFATRSPCTEPTDGRMVDTVTSQPTGMSDQNWTFLQTLPFGAIIFANPAEGEKPMSEMIAGGDNDGDLYFICWNTEILDSVCTVPMDRRLETEPEPKQEREYDTNWLDRSQELMIDLESQTGLGQLIGKLYNLWKEKSTKSADNIHSEDCIHFAAACKAAIDLGKHGRKVYLPQHLHDEVGKSLQRCLVATEEDTVGGE